MGCLRALLADERGDGMIEYAIVLGSIAVGAIAGLMVISGKIGNFFASTNRQLANLPNS